MDAAAGVEEPPLVDGEDPPETPGFSDDFSEDFPEPDFSEEDEPDSPPLAWARLSVR